MIAQQQLVGAGGVGLIIANAWTGPQRTQLAGLFGGTGSTTDAHTALKHIGVEALAVGALTLAAGGSDQIAGAAAAVLGILWLVWWMRRSPSPRAAAPGAPHGPTTGTVHAYAA